MTRDELLRTCTWDQYDANITVESAVFGGPVQVRFLPEFESGRVITERVVDQREFGIYSAEDAYAQSNLTGVSIPEAPTARHRYGSIDFEPAWAWHGCSIILKDGRFIAAYSNDWHFGQYEDDETAPAA